MIPVIIFTYNRLEHTKMTLEALEKNKGIQNFILFIFSDGGKTEEDCNKVDNVRGYLHKYRNRSKFSSVYIYEADRNRGLADSIIFGVSKIFQEFEAVIVLEDDLIVSEDFLEYMSNALKFYENDMKIWSISGYSFTMKSLRGYANDIFFSYRASSWGWATWRNRWNLVDWKVSDYCNFKYNYRMRKNFKRGGNDLSQCLDLQMAGWIDSWAIRWVYFQFKNEMLTVYPTISKVKNIGLDGSGTHCKTSKEVSNLFNIQVNCNKKLKFMSINLNQQILKEFQNSYKRYGVIKYGMKLLICKVRNFLNTSLNEIV